MQLDGIGRVIETGSTHEVNTKIQRGWVLLRIVPLPDRNIYILGERRDKKDEKL